MKRQEYLEKLLTSGYIQFEWTGSDYGLDCVRVCSDLFHKQKSYAIYINVYILNDK